MAHKTTIVDIIREIRRKASLNALKILEEAEKQGIPREQAEQLADKIMLYELTPQEALAKLKQLAKENGKAR